AAALREIAQAVEEARRVAGAEHRRRLVEQQQIDRAAQRARQLYLLALAGGQCADAGVWFGVAADRAQRLGGGDAHRLTPQQSQPAALLVAEEDPRRGVEIGRQDRLLWPPTDARPRAPPHVAGTR